MTKKRSYDRSLDVTLDKFEPHLIWKQRKDFFPSFLADKGGKLYFREPSNLGDGSGPCACEGSVIVLNLPSRLLAALRKEVRND